MENLKSRIERVISECKDIMKKYESEFADSNKTVSFNQVKVIENAIERLKRQNLPVLEDLNKLKISLLSKHENYKEMMAMYNKFQESLSNIAASAINQKHPSFQNKETVIRRSIYRKPANYEKPLGSKGNTNLEDYLIPVIKLMWSGHSHAEAFKQIARKLGVEYSTVSAQCTRALDLTTDEFIRQVNSKTILSLIKKKYPDQHQKINVELNINSRED